jgi:thiosulfate reductase cytochrome b subunit
LVDARKGLNAPVGQEYSEGTRQMEKTNDHYLKRLNRLLVWPTLILSAIFVISGYGITNPGLVTELTGGALTRAVSLKLHLALAFPILVLLTIHILIGAKSALTRWGVKEGILLNVFLLLVGIFTMSLLALMQYFIL